MRKQFIMLSFLGIFMVGGGLSSLAHADDVYVDLSVLRGLNDSSAVYSNAPLFPEVKSSREPIAQMPSVAPHKKTVQPQKSKPRKKLSKQKTPEKIIIPEKVVPVSGLKVSVPAVELKTVSENMEKDAAAPVAEIKKEPLPELKVEPSLQPELDETATINQDADLNSETAQVSAQPIVAHGFQAAKEQQKVVQAVQNAKAAKDEQSLPSVLPSSQDSNSLPADVTTKKSFEDNVSAPVVPQPISDDKSKQEDSAQTDSEQMPKNVAVSETKQPQLLVPSPKDNVAVASDNGITFAVGSDVLTPENQQKVDTIIAGFANPKDNMIAIYAYNYDDGNDAFNKKRLSLRRIVAIRSYLLNKGYKNFMPKVINLPDDNPKSNLVEIEEVQ